MSSPSTEEPNDRTVLSTLRGILPNLSPSEARVARAAIEHPAATAASTIGELARLCETSETTVIRLCRTIGFTGYPEFRLALAGAAAARGGDEYLSGEILPDDSVDQVVRKVMGADAAAISETAKHVSIPALTEAARAIGAARRIDLYGSGASGFVAQDLHFKLHRVGLLSFTFADPQAAISSAALLAPGDVALGLSHTGTTQDTVRYLDVARTTGATTVAITNHPRSAITRRADILITTAAQETTFRSGAMASRIAQLTVVDALFVLVAQQRVEATKDALKRTFEAVRSQQGAK
jgi:DNA-binding MurR/RpiR family transcriptional regulator